jgi:hypothetical protein
VSNLFGFSRDSKKAAGVAEEGNSAVVFRYCDWILTMNCFSHGGHGWKQHQARINRPHPRWRWGGQGASMQTHADTCAPKQSICAATTMLGLCGAQQFIYASSACPRVDFVRPWHMDLTRNAQRPTSRWTKGNRVKRHEIYNFTYRWKSS